MLEQKANLGGLPTQRIFLKFSSRKIGEFVPNFDEHIFSDGLGNNHQLASVVIN